MVTRLPRMGLIECLVTTCRDTVAINFRMVGKLDNESRLRLVTTCDSLNFLFPRHSVTR